MSGLAQMQGGVMTEVNGMLVGVGSPKRSVGALKEWWKEGRIHPKSSRQSWMMSVQVPRS
jgi:hypothetical protein